jgi:hypothetical protein
LSCPRRGGPRPSRARRSTSGRGSAAIAGGRAARGASTACAATRDCVGAARMGTWDACATWAGASWQAICTTSHGAWRHDTTQRGHHGTGRSLRLTALGCHQPRYYLAPAHFAAQNSTSAACTCGLRSALASKASRRSCSQRTCGREGIGEMWESLRHRCTSSQGRVALCLRLRSESTPAGAPAGSRWRCTPARSGGMPPYTSGSARSRAGHAARTRRRTPCTSGRRLAGQPVL